ncbi:MAG TPA: hypothetical protein VFG37_05605 [Planctomycetota bacterium]|jgi:hypothetical protein|nr:hypothetical protein [Planctomycetota bacterium]
MSEPIPVFRRFVECAAFALLAACVGTGMRTRGANPATRTALAEYPVASSEPRSVAAPPASSSSREAVAGPDAALRCDLVSRIAARGGWSRNDRRRDAVAAWFDEWSAATHRRFAAEQEALRERLGRDFIADDAAAIARLVPLYAWDEAGGTLRRVGADGKPLAPDDGDAEVVTTVASK